MPANLATRNGRVTMAYAGTTGSVWHNTGEDVRTRQTAAGILRAAYMDYTVSTRPVRFQSSPDGAFDQDAGALRVIVRDDANIVLGYATKSYNPIQNTVSADSVEAILGEGCYAETAGALGQGERCWILAHLDSSDFEVGAGDRVRPYLLAHWGHDGRTPLTFRLVGTRVVCENTVNAAMGEAKAAIRIKHHSSAKVRIDAAREALGIVRKQIPDMAAAFRALAAKPLTTAKAADYFAGLFPYPSREYIGEYTDAMMRVDDQRGLLLRLFDGAGLGADLTTARGTAWGAYNAVGEWIDHAYPVLASGKVSRDRLESTMVGTYAEKRREAFEAALAL